MSETKARDDNGGGATRRDFLYYATAGTGVVATGAAIWPLINQMNPSADVLSLAKVPGTARLRRSLRRVRPRSSWC